MAFDKSTYLRQQLEQRSTQDLEEQLETALQADTPDGELVRTLLQVLEQRDTTPVTISPEEQALWDAFKDGRRKAAEAKQKRRRKTLRMLTTLAAVFTMVLLVLPQMVQANNWIELAARWSDSFFELFSPGTPEEPAEDYVFQTDNPGLQQVYDAVTDMGITVPVVPMWLEDGYELVELEKVSSPTKGRVHARFNKENRTIILMFDYYVFDAPYKAPKDAPDPIDYEYNGVNHYIFQSHEYLSAVWIREDNIVCTLSVDCSEDTLKKILRSIYTQEET